MMLELSIFFNYCYYYVLLHTVAGFTISNSTVTVAEHDASLSVCSVLMMTPPAERLAIEVTASLFTVDGTGKT